MRAMGPAPTLVPSSISKPSCSICEYYYNHDGEVIVTYLSRVCRSASEGCALCQVIAGVIVQWHVQWRGISPSGMEVTEKEWFMIGTSIAPGTIELSGPPWYLEIFTPVGELAPFDCGTCRASTPGALQNLGRVGLIIFIGDNPMVQAESYSI